MIGASIAAAVHLRAGLHGCRRQDKQSPDLRALHPLVGRHYQLRRAPKQLRAVRGNVAGDVLPTGVGVERHGLDVAGELGRGRGEDGLELGEDAAAGGRSTVKKSPTACMISVTQFPTPAVTSPQGDDDR